LTGNDKGFDAAEPEKAGPPTLSVAVRLGMATPYRFSTEVRIVPDTLPFAEKLKAAVK
jgi:hypothetical protein